MGFRRKIKIVTGFWGDHVMIALWETLSKSHDVEFLVLQDGLEAHIKTSIPVTFFPQIPEMPGFYRDLDQYLAGSDLVVGVEATRLHSFQALRCAKAMGVPCVILAHEFTPMFYDKFTNIKAIQFDILQNADLFLTSSHRASRLLFSQGVAKERVHRVPHYCDAVRDGFDVARAAKFRNYIGVRPDELLVVARAHFTKSSGAPEILKGMRSSLSTLPVQIASRIRLLMIGLGSDLEDLKYQAVDLGLGSRAIFMNQDPQPFWRDVISASHMIIWDRWSNKEQIEPYPFAMMSGLANGVPSAIPIASIFDEASSGVSVIRLEEMVALDISEAVVQTFSDIGHLMVDRARISSFAADHCNVHTAADAVLNSLMELSGAAGTVDVRSKVELFVESMTSPITLASAKDVVVKVEESLLVQNLSRETIAELWRIKGDAFTSLTRGEEAMTSYEKAIHLSPQCFRGFRGLGFLAWQGHSHDDAIGFFKRALAIAPNDYHATMGVGLVYRRLRMLDESIYWLQKAVELGGPESSAIGLLVQACVESSDSPSSLEALEDLRHSFGDIPSVIRGLSQVYLAQGRGDEAGPLLDQVST